MLSKRGLKIGSAGAIARPPRPPGYATGRKYDLLLQLL